MSLIGRLRGHIREGSLTQRDYKYCCVQTITTKLDEIPISTIVSKKDYSVERLTGAGGIQGSAFSVKDNIPPVFPEQYMESMTLINELENMKVNAIIGIDPDTGLITKVLNHNEIIALWDEEKKQLMDKYNFLKDTARSNVPNNLIKLEDKIIYQYDEFMESLIVNPFYSTFLGQHSVSDELCVGNDTVLCAFHLLPDNKFSLKTQRKSEVREDGTLLRGCSGKNTPDPRSDETIRKAHNEKVKPLTQYSSMQYNVNPT